MLKVLCGIAGCPPPAPQPPRDEQTAAPLPTRSHPSRGAGDAQPVPWGWPLLSSPRAEPCGLPSSMAGAVRGGKAGPGIKIRTHPAMAAWAVFAAGAGWAAGDLCHARHQHGEEKPSGLSQRRGGGLLNKEPFFFYF